jgi:DNA-binding winged helix-turn-helix (wHTH) protein
MQSTLQTEAIRFRLIDGFCERNGVSVWLTPNERKILELARTHSGEILSAKRIFDSVWNELGDNGWRGRVDIQLSGLRNKLNKLGEGLLINHRGLGYSLACSIVLIDDRHDTAPPQPAPEAISFDDLLKRMRPQDRGGQLAHLAEVIVQSPEPLEFVFDHANDLVENVRTGEISYLFFVPADSLEAVVKLIETFVSAASQTPSDADDTVNALQRDELLHHVSQLKIIVTSPPMLDTIYILNCRSNNLAAAYYCSTQYRRATCLKERNEARDMADKLRASVPDRSGGILGFAEGVDRVAVCTKLGTLILKRNANIEREVLHALAPEVFQRAFPIGHSIH